MSIEMTTRDIFMRYSGPDGKKHVQQHRVWDADRFISARKADAVQLNTKEADPKQRNAGAEQITEETYRKETHHGK